jgi:Cu-processing system permease protein
LLVPLVSIVFGTIHFYNSREFIEMLLSQPVKRNNIFWSEYLGLSVSLSTGFLIGVIFPLSLYGFSIILLYLAVTGVFLSFIFVAISMFNSISYDEKVKGIGLSFFIWFYFALLFDGLVLLIYVLFNDYPLEKIIIFLTCLNPIDLSRIMILLKLDISALMGYSGATFHKFFGSLTGTIGSLSMLILWTAIPVLFALRKFRKKNF